MWDLGFGTPGEVVSPNFHVAQQPRLLKLTSGDLGHCVNLHNNIWMGDLYSF